MIRVASAEDSTLVRVAREQVAAEAGWLGLHAVLTAVTTLMAWSGLPGVWPALLWVLAGVIGADVLTGFRSVWVAVRDWRRMRRSAAFRVLTRDLDEAHERAWRTYRAALRAEVAARAEVADPAKVTPVGGAR